LESEQGGKIGDSVELPQREDTSTRRSSGLPVKGGKKCWGKGARESFKGRKRDKKAWGGRVWGVQRIS